MRDYSDAAKAALASGEAIVAAALGIYSAPDPAFVWSGPWPIMIDGDLYAPLDDRAIGGNTSGAIGGTAQALELSLSGVDAQMIELIETKPLMRAPSKLYRLLFDGSGTQLLDCRIFKRGRIDAVDIADVLGGASTIKLTIETAARGLGRSGKRMRSDADQRLVDPADGFFKHCSYAGKKTIYFGGKPSAATA